MLITKASDQTRQRGAHVLYLYSSSLSPECLALPSPLPCYSVDSLGRQFLNQHFIVYTFLFPPKSPPFPTSRLQLLWGFLRFFASPPPSPVLPLISRPCTLVLSIMRGLAGASGLAAADAGYSLALSTFLRLPTHLY